MDKNKLNKILEYYTEDNLNKISRKIIDAYKSKHYSYLIGLGNLIDESIVKRNQNIQKLFSYLIMQFHPDRTNYYLKDIRKLISDNNPDIENYAHIIAVTENLENIQIPKLQENLNPEIEYEYGYDEEDFDSVIDGYDDEGFYTELENSKYDFDFISLIRYREFGNIDEALPSYYLEGLEGELTLTDSNLFDLSGLEQCGNINALDLSNNQITEITQLGLLTQLKELNLSGNAIQDIEVINNMKALQKLDLSFNNIDNILPLYDLSKLEYLNVIGNKITLKQIELFRKKNMILIF